MAETIYRKYRPQTFNEMIGQNHVKITLQNEIAQGKVAHAYLFSGPRGIGKTTIARILAKALNCEKRKPKESEPCNQCSSCEEIKNGRSLNIIEIDAASHTGVDNVRDNIIANTRVPAPQGKYKVFIIDEVHMLSTAAFNALLKTLEEPPKNVAFILATTEIHKVPQTIISRCQRFDFKHVSTKEMVKRLQSILKEEGREADKEVLEGIARASEGSQRDAESLLGQILSLDGKKITLEEAELIIPRSDIGLVFEFFGHLSSNDSSKGIELINRLIDEGVDLNNFIKELIGFLRNILIYKFNHDAELISFGLQEADEAKLNNILTTISEFELVEMIELFIEKRQEMKTAPIAQLPLELAVAEWSLKSKKKIIDEPFQKITTEKVLPSIKIPEKVAKISKKDEELKIIEKEKDIPQIVSITFTEILRGWNNFLEKLSGKNHGLSSLLKMNQVIGLEGNKLKIGSIYKFHIERLNELKNKLIIDETLKEAYNQPLSIACVLQEMKGEVQNIEEEDKNSIEGAVKNILEVFGGEVVE